MFTELARPMRPRMLWRQAGPIGHRSTDNVVPLVMTVAEACQALQISSWSLNKLIRTRKLATIKIGRRRLVPLAAIHKFVQAQAEEADA
jgi:excisionase family DNA binding protein